MGLFIKKEREKETDLKSLLQQTLIFYCNNYNSFIIKPIYPCCVKWYVLTSRAATWHTAHKFTSLSPSANKQNRNRWPPSKGHLEYLGSQHKHQVSLRRNPIDMFLWENIGIHLQVIESGQQPHHLSSFSSLNTGQAILPHHRTQRRQMQKGRVGVRAAKTGLAEETSWLSKWNLRIISTTLTPSLGGPTRVASVTHAGLAKGYSSAPIVSLVAIPVTNCFPSASTENKGCFIRFLYTIQWCCQMNAKIWATALLSPLRRNYSYNWGLVVWAPKHYMTGFLSIWTLWMWNEEENRAVALPNLHPFPLQLFRKYKWPQEKSKVRVNTQLALLPPSSWSLLVPFPLDCDDQRLELGEGGHEEGNSHRTHHVWSQQSWKTGVLLIRSLPCLYKWQHLWALEMHATHTLFLQVTILGHKSWKLEFSEVPKCPGVTTVLQTVCLSSEEDVVLGPAWHQPV